MCQVYDVLIQLCVWCGSTCQVAQLVDQERVGASEGDGLCLFHSAHGQLCVVWGDRETG